MGYISQFKEILCQHSNSDIYDEAILEWTYQGDIENKPNSCICGHSIMQNCIVWNKLNGNKLVIGNCCINKFGIIKEHFNKSRINYLEYALTKVETEKAKAFVEDMTRKLKQYDSLKMSDRQKEWLESIANKPYRWNYKW